MIDIVIPYRKSNTEELKYTLRGLENIPHRDVYVIGDKTEFSVKHIPFKHSADIAKNTYDILLLAVNTPEVSKDFIWWHDDMVLLEPIEELPVFHQGSYDDILKGAPKGYYTRNKEKTNEALKAEGVETPLFYDVHFPFMFNKKKVSKIQDKLLGVNKISYYANHYKIKGEQIDTDFKVRKDEDYSKLLISTYDPSFNKNRAGRYIRETLSTPSRYEVGEEQK